MWVFAKMKKKVFFVNFCANQSAFKNRQKIVKICGNMRSPKKNTTVCLSRSNNSEAPKPSESWPYLGMDNSPLMVGDVLDPKMLQGFCPPGELTDPGFQGSFESVSFLFPRWDMLILWRVCVLHMWFTPLQDSWITHPMDLMRFCFPFEKVWQKTSESGTPLSHGKSDVVFFWWFPSISVICVMDVLLIYNRGSILYF